MITDNGVDMVGRDNATEELKALASPVHLELEGAMTIRDDYDGGTWSKSRPQLSNTVQHSTILIDQEG